MPLRYPHEKQKAATRPRGDETRTHICHLSQLFRGSSAELWDGAGVDAQQWSTNSHPRRGKQARNWVVVDGGPRSGKSAIALTVLFRFILFLSRFRFLFCMTEMAFASSVPPYPSTRLHLVWQASTTTKRRRGPFFLLLLCGLPEFSPQQPLSPGLGSLPGCQRWMDGIMAYT
ncbi:hypothetical protein BT67DRAFT_20153 [Trichocladium antarcticum]|uniref:Uncharacterized protein n=1 Tax=Trichocladium antarcticum TaxID=1450529 RepID=A0AAN6UTN6_9PEZI|nr:hypothetical protein BT67DRAFT_20153 [Trichocladium antarcticum]